jgi:integrase
MLTISGSGKFNSTLRHMFSKAVEWNLIEKSPFTRCKRLFYKEDNVRLRYLTEVEENRLLRNCIGHIKPIVITALNTGMRKGEILTLKWGNIRNGFIYLHKTKTGEARQVPINETLASLLRSLPRHIASDYVFCNKEGKAYADVKKSFKTAVKKAGIQDFRFHDLRHSFASRLVSKGASLKAVQELLGHKEIRMTLRYSHLADDHKKDVVRLLDGVNTDESVHRVDKES